MNIVLLADKKIRKGFESAVKNNPDITLLGTEMIIRGNTMSRIAEHHNPHILVIYHSSVPEKDGLTVNDVISFLHVKRPNMRIIYVYGKVKSVEAFTETAGFLTSNGIYDIVTESDFNKVIEVIGAPMSENDVNLLLDEFQQQQEESCQSAGEEDYDSRIYEALEIDFPTVTSLTDFDIDHIETLTTKSASSKNETLVIGIAQLQHHNGCTHTAFEIAAMLSKKNNVAVIMADNETYENLLSFHKLNPIAASKGVNVRGIDVYPYSMFKTIKEEYSAVICDFSYLRSNQKNVYAECDVKIMLSSAAEWDIGTLMNYVNYASEDYIHKINFLFPRVAQSRFIKFNKQLIKSGYNAYRLHTSPDWSCPHTQNILAYKDILSAYTIKSSAKPKKRLMRIK